MTSVITIKFTHITSGAELLLPINDEQFRTFLSPENLVNDRIKDRLFADVMFRYIESNEFENNYFDDYNFNGIFLGTVRKDRT